MGNSHKIFGYRSFDSVETANEFSRTVAAATGHSAFVIREDSIWVVKYVDLERLEAALESGDVLIDPDPYLSFTTRRNFGDSGLKSFPHLRNALQYALQAASTKGCTAKLARKNNGGFEVIYPSNADFSSSKEFDSLILEQLKRKPGLQMASPTITTQQPKEPPSQSHFYLLAHMQAWSLGGLMFQNNLDNARRYASDELQGFIGWLEGQQFPVAELELYIVGDDCEPPLYLGKAIEMARAIAEAPRGGEKLRRQSIMCSPLEFWMRVQPLAGVHWAVIIEDNKFVTIYFLDQEHCLIDQLRFQDVRECRQSLRANNFIQWGSDPVLSSLWKLPQPPFEKVDHQQLKIFSRGLVWN